MSITNPLGMVLSEGEVQPERRLWAAVIHSAWQDLFGSGKSYASSAREFLIGGGNHMRWRDWVCESVGLFTGDRLRSAALAELKRRDEEAARRRERQLFLERGR